MLKREDAAVQNPRMEGRSVKERVRERVCGRERKRVRVRGQ